MDLRKLKGYAQKIKEDSSGLKRCVATKLAGVTFEGKQEHLAKMTESTEIRLERDRRNSYDFYAIKVMANLNGIWENVGFIPREINRSISRSLDDGEVLVAKVVSIVGGYESSDGVFLNYGAEISIGPKRLMYC